MTTSAPATEPITDEQRKRLFAALNHSGLTEADEQRDWMTGILGRDVESRGSLSKAEASRLIDALSDGSVRRERLEHPEPPWPISIEEAVRRVTYDIGQIGVGKEGYNETQRYRFRGIDQFVNSLSPILARHGVTLLPSVQPPTVTQHPTAKGGTQFMFVMLVDWTIVGPAGDTLAARTIGQAMDSSDKAANKAMSNAYKYLLAQVFCVPNIGWTEPDADSPEVDTQPGTQQHPQPPQRQATPPAQEAQDRLHVLDRIAQLAIGQGKTPEVFTRKFREERGNLTWDQFIQLSPSVLTAFVRRVESYIASQGVPQVGSEPPAGETR